MTVKCDSCKDLGLTFHSTTISPDEYIEGSADAKIWIVGLNPKADIGKIETRTKQEFIDFNPNIHPYFHDFKKVSAKLYANWQSADNNVAHTDLVKCFSQTFPPSLSNKNIDKEKIINNCKRHLFHQIKKHKPKIIICNGTNVCNEMIKFFPPENQTEPVKYLTSYQTSYIDDNNNRFQFWIILSGFIGRIDDRNKRRLGKELEKIIEEEQIKL